MKSVTTPSISHVGKLGRHARAALARSRRRRCRRRRSARGARNGEPRPRLAAVAGAEVDELLPRPTAAAIASRCCARRSPARCASGSTRAARRSRRIERAAQRVVEVLGRDACRHREQPGDERGSFPVAIRGQSIDDAQQGHGFAWQCVAPTASPLRKSDGRWTDGGVCDIRTSGVKAGRRQKPAPAAAARSSRCRTPVAGQSVQSDRRRRAGPTPTPRDTDVRPRSCRMACRRPPRRRRRQDSPWSHRAQRFAAPDDVRDGARRDRGRDTPPVPVPAGYFGLHATTSFELATGATVGARLLPQAAWYFRDETIAVPCTGHARGRIRAPRDHRRRPSPLAGDARRRDPARTCRRWSGSRRRTLATTLHARRGRLDDRCRRPRVAGALGAEDPAQPLVLRRRRRTPIFARRPLRLRGERAATASPSARVWPEDLRLPRRSPPCARSAPTPIASRCAR